MRGRLTCGGRVGQFPQAANGRADQPQRGKQETAGADEHGGAQSDGLGYHTAQQRSDGQHAAKRQMRGGVDAAQDVGGRDRLPQGQFVDTVNRPAHIAELSHGEHSGAQRYRSARQRRQQAGGRGQQGGEDERGTQPEARHQAFGGQRSEHAAESANGDDRAQQRGADLQLAYGEQDIQAASKAEENGGGGRAQQQSAQNRLVPGGPQPFHDLAPDVGGRVRFGPPLRLTDQPHGERGAHERDGVEQDGHGRRDGGYQRACESRSNYSGQGLGQGQLAVALQQIVSAHQRREISLIAHVEPHGQGRSGGGHRVKVRHSQLAEHGGERQGEQHGGAPQVGADQNRAAAQAVGPGSGEEAEQQNGGRAGSAQETHLERRGVQQFSGDYRQPDQGDPGADLRDGLPGPQLEEVGFAPQAAHAHLPSIACQGLSNLMMDSAPNRLYCV